MRIMKFLEKIQFHLGFIIVQLFISIPFRAFIAHPIIKTLQVLDILVQNLNSRVEIHKIIDTEILNWMYTFKISVALFILK